MPSMVSLNSRLKLPTTNAPQNNGHSRSLISRISSQLAVRTFLAFLVIVTIWLAYGKANFYRDPGSIFYDEGRAFIRWYSAYREQEAKTFIHEVAERSRHGHHDFPKANENVTMCAVFITEIRGAIDHYLEVSVGSILQGLEENEREDLNVQLFFANSDPSRHPLWFKPWLRHLVDRVYTYADLYTFDAMADILALEKAPNSVAKGPLDYALALQQCHDNTTAQLIAVFEDDIIAAQSWFSRSVLAAKEAQSQTEQIGKPGKWAYIRIFNQERSTGWMSREVGGNNEVLISLIVASIVYILLMVLRRRIRMWLNINLDTSTMAVICCIAIPTFVVLFYQSGKASLLPPSPGVREEEFGCCTQALVYNRQHVPEIIDFVHSWATKGDRFVLVRDFTYQQGLGKFSLYPMMTQYIGPQSTIRTIKRYDSKVWSMAFESLTPSKMETDHLDFVKRLYGNPISQ